MSYSRRTWIDVLRLALLASAIICNTAAVTEAENAGAAEVGPDDLGFDEIVFVKRYLYSSDHYYSDIDNGTRGPRFVAENGIFVYNVRTKQERPVVTGADLPGGKGFIGKISLSFDAKKVLFDVRLEPRLGFRIWEVGIDGSGLRQVSFPPEDEAEKAARRHPRWHSDYGTNDIHPCYLPDGDIIFSSTRSEHTVLCGASGQFMAPSLHRMTADGKNIRQLTNSPVSEFCPVVLSDGRVMYHRWEYIDRGARVGKTIWSMNPDGTKAQELYGVADDSTTVYMYPQPIPGNEHLVVTVGTAHFPQGGCLGAIMLIDTNHPNRTRGPDPDEAGYVQWDDRYAVTNLTPHVFIERRTEPGWHFLVEPGKYVHRGSEGGHLYTHPFPINDKQFLVSCRVDPSKSTFSLYLIDTEGNHSLVHQDAKLSCWHATPLVARKVPPQVEPARDPQYLAANKALCLVSNVYQGMEGVEPGEVKWIRINEAVPRYWSTGERWGSPKKALFVAHSSLWKGALWPRVQCGVVPVEEDGSAYFEVPAGRNIFFQALDEDFREIQRERTYVNYQAGEIRSCTGCHGDAGRVVSQVGADARLALQRPPSKPQPQPCDLVENGGTGLAGQVIHYPTDIQPIFDAKCVSCHGATEPDGKLRLTGELTEYFNTSYEELARKQLAGPIISEFTTFIDERGRADYNGAFLPPKSLGSHKSPMMDLLTDPAHPKNAQDDHSGMLTENELMILTRWVDSNYQFYGTYYGRHSSHWVNPDPAVPAYQPSDLRRKPTFEEAVSKSAPPWHR